LISISGVFSAVNAGGGYIAAAGLVIQSDLGLLSAKLFVRFHLV
jgi:hypothetical protein